MSSSKSALLAMAWLACWPAVVNALPCREVVCPGETGKEGGPSTSGGSSTGGGCPSQSGADCKHSCPSPAPGTCPASTQVTYLSIDNPKKGDLRESCDSHGKCTVKLVGDLFIPPHTGAKKFPTIIFNHGSVNPGCSTCEHTPGKPCAIAAFFVSHGYVVFMPHRRGYTPSTGVNQAGPLTAEASDVIDAFNFLKNHESAVVDINKVALLGHSLGGMVSIFANEQDFGQVVVTSIAGGSESWCGNDSLHAQLKTSVVAAKTPIYFLEPKDDVNTGPTIELSHDMGQAGHRFQAAIFGPVGNDPDVGKITCGSEAHVCFVEDTFQVSRWAPSVLEWLQRFGVK